MASGFQVNEKFTWLWVKTNMIPYWSRCTTQFCLFYWGLECSLGILHNRMWQRKIVNWVNSLFDVYEGPGGASARRNEQIPEPPT